MQGQELKKLNIPDKPGVYFFIGSPKTSEGGSKILYIGKATSLRDRVKSYFPSTLLGTSGLLQSRGPLILDMIFKTKRLKWQETDSVLEALILEANLIKKYQPIYNTKEKSDKSFNYVCITEDPFPKILIKRGKDILQKQENSANIYGPFPNGSQLKEALKIIRRIFPFLDEKSNPTSPKFRGAGNNYEFYRQLKLAPEGNDYKKNIKNIKLLFEGKKRSILKNLEKEMKGYAKIHEFEKAGEIKKKIFALKHIQDVALIKEDLTSPREISSRFTLPGVPGGTHTIQKSHEVASFRIEAYDIAHMGGKEMVGVMTVLEDGEASKNEYRKFKIKGFEKSNDTGALLEVLERRFSHQEWPMPKLIVIDGGKAQLNTVLKFQEKVGLQIPVVSVVKDERHKPKGFLGDKKYISKREKEILLANSEAHRFAVGYHRYKVRKLFIKKHA